MERIVSKQTVEVLSHPNADALDIIKLGTTQLVARKGTYQTGDTVIVIPAKAVLPEGPLRDEFAPMLTGPLHDRVRAVRLRGEYSCGVTWPLDQLYFLSDDAYRAVKYAEIGQDISEALGITFYEPPIPPQFAGRHVPMSQRPDINAAHFGHHDCVHLATYLNQIAEHEVIVTEKLHGSQINVYWTGADLIVTSKGLAGKGVHIVEEEGNIYWRAVRAQKLEEVMQREFPGVAVQVFGEVIPVQKGYSYGQTTPCIHFFEARIEGQSVHRFEMPVYFQDWWVPVLHEGDFDYDTIIRLSKGKETVSGKGLHIREGVVVQPADPSARAHDRSRLKLKVINPKYKDSDDEIN